MTVLAGAVAFAIQVLAAFLCLTALAAFLALWRGSAVLQRLGSGVARDDSAMLLKSAMVPAVSVLAVARDAAPSARDFVRRLLKLHFGSHEVVLVLDGVSPSAVETWIQEFALMRSSRDVPDGPAGAAPHRVREIYESADPYNLVVIDREQGGEPDVLNAAVRVATAPWLALIGPECDFEPTLLLRMIRPALEWPEETLGVCAVAPAPPSGGLAGHLGSLESLRTWLARAAAFSGWNLLAPIPGASMLLKKRAVVAAGGFRDGALEMFLRLHAMARTAGAPYTVAFIPDAVSRAGSPRTLAELRGAVGFDQGQIARALAFRSSWGRGLLPLGSVLPGLYSIRFLRPLAETVLYALTAVGLAAGWVDPALAGLVLVATVGAGIIVSMSAVVFGERADADGRDPGRLARMFFTAIPENLGYRQLRNFWLISGYRKGAAAGRKQRRGREPETPPPAASHAVKR